MPISIKEAFLVLRRGGIVGYPTETVYGIGSLIDNEGAIRRIKKLKGRDGRKPLLVAFPSISKASKYVVLSKEDKAFLKKVLPGPVSFLARRIPGKIPNSVTGGKEAVGIRVPDNETALLLAEKFGAIISTSANRSGEPPALSAEEAEKALGLFTVIAGECKYKTASTLIDLSDGKILRKGAYPEKKLVRLWKEAHK